MSEKITYQCEDTIEARLDCINKVIKSIQKEMGSNNKKLIEEDKNDLFTKTIKDKREKLFLSIINKEWFKESGNKVILSFFEREFRKQFFYKYVDPEFFGPYFIKHLYEDDLFNDKIDFELEYLKISENQLEKIEKSKADYCFKHFIDNKTFVKELVNNTKLIEFNAIIDKTIKEKDILLYKHDLLHFTNLYHKEFLKQNRLFMEDEENKLSDADYKIKNTIEKIIDNSMKKVIYGDNDKINKLEKLKNKFPNFGEVIDFIIGRVKISIESLKPLRIPPINLQGDPGIGKTLFSKDVANALDTDNLSINISMISASMEFIGSSSKWLGGDLGLLTKNILLEAQCYQPVILLDELCKATMKRQSGNGGQLLPAILPILERETAKKTFDNFLDFSYDASNPFYISTTNDFEILPDPLKSRILNFEIVFPNKEQSFMISKNIYKGCLEQEFITNMNIENEEIFHALNGLSPRNIRNVITNTINQKFVDGNNTTISLEDIKKSKDKIIKKENKIGF